jgi:dihydroneopterin aldolase
MTTRLFLSGIRASGHHGARPKEKDEAQEFVVDLDVEVRPGGDAVGVTADYRGITETVRRVVAEESFDLIETLAGEVATAVQMLPHVVGVTAVVHKPNAAKSLGIDGVAAASSSVS